MRELAELPGHETVMTKIERDTLLSAGKTPIHDSFKRTVARAIERARALGIKLTDKQIEQLIAVALEVHQQTVGEVSKEALESLPRKAPVLFSEHFQERRRAHRDNFLEKEGRKPFPNNDREDYTPVNFLHEVYGPFVDAGVVTGKYLENIDPQLYRALVDYVRGSNEHRAGRRPTTMEEIGVRSQRDLERRLRLAEREKAN